MNMLTAGLLTWIWDGNAFQFVLNLIDEFLSKMGGIAESGHVRPLAEIDGACFVIAGMRNVGL